MTPEDAELLIRVIYYGHTGSGGDPGTTILADGRVIWSEDYVEAVVARLTPEEIGRMRDDIDATQALEADGEYGAKRRPGPEPPGHGVNSYRFEVMRDGRPVVVYSQDPRSFAGEEQFWIIPPEMRSLARLARRLDDPIAGLGSDAFSAEARPYGANRFLVQILLSDQRGDGNYRADDVRWPFGEPIEQAGVPYEMDDEYWHGRCLVIDSTMATTTAAAEHAVGADRDLSQFVTIVDYDAPAGGSVSVVITALLPHESGSCVELLETPR